MGKGEEVCHICGKDIPDRIRCVPCFGPLVGQEHLYDENGNRKE